MRLSVFPTALVLTHGILVFGGPLSVRKEIRDVAQDSALFQPFLTALNTPLDTPTRESASNLDASVMEAPFVPLSDGLGNIYAALCAASSPGLSRPNTPAFQGFQSGVSTVSTDPTNPISLNIPVGSNENSYPPHSASTPGSDSSLDSIVGYNSVFDTQPGDESPGIESSFQTAMKLPDHLASDVNRLLAKGGPKVCFYPLSADKKGLKTWDFNCEGTGTWSDFGEQEVGFALYNAGNNRVLSLMNVVHAGYHKVTEDVNNFQTRDRWVSNENTVFGLGNKDEEVLQSFKKDWIKTVARFLPKGWRLISEDGIRDESTFKKICSEFFGINSYLCTH
ncbi:hypothetical protein MMC07_004800 [Pseudocyphellaria aurata]|nr:hypothetical protein [Pseudocyphellaria aurata]